MEGGGGSLTATNAPHPYCWPNGVVSRVEMQLCSEVVTHVRLWRFSGWKTEEAAVDRPGRPR